MAQINKTALFLCLLLSFILWVIFTLNNVFSDNYSFNVKYANVPKDKISISELNTVINAELNGTGWSLLAYNNNENKIQEIEIDINEIEGFDRIRENEIATKIEKIIPNNLNIKEISPRTIPLVFEDKYSKKVPIVFNSKISLAENYEMLGNIDFEPDSITVSGPKSLVNTVKFWETDTLKLNNLKKKKSGTIALQDTEEFNLDYSTNEISYSINVEQFTEKKLNISILPINVSKDSILLLPKQVSLSCFLPLSFYEKINATDFEIVADFKNDVKKDLVYLSLVKQPAYVKKIIFAPTVVEFIKYE